MYSKTFGSQAQEGAMLAVEKSASIIRDKPSRLIIEGAAGRGVEHILVMSVAGMKVAKLA
jgi:hypothetical protein